MNKNINDIITAANNAISAMEWKATITVTDGEEYYSNTQTPAPVEITRGDITVRLTPMEAEELIGDSIANCGATYDDYDRNAAKVTVVDDDGDEIETAVYRAEFRGADIDSDHACIYIDIIGADEAEAEAIRDGVNNI